MPAVKRQFPIDTGRPLQRIALDDGLFIEISAPRQLIAGAPVVLLVHGASASSNTFKDPNGGLLEFLERRPAGAGDPRPFNVYTLDWRSSMRTADELIAPFPRPPLGLFTLDAAIDDLKAGLEHVARASGVAPAEIGVVGHCIGGALVAQAIALGQCPAKRVVLSTLGLFFQVGVEGWVKGNDFVLEDLLIDPGNSQFVISALAASEPRFKWPSDLEERYALWLGSGLHHGCQKRFCERVSFMYGMPFRLDDMSYLHEMEGGLESQFGSMPLAIYSHCLRNLRRGWAAPYDGPDLALVSDAARQNFAGRRVTLITGNENQVWHRNSIDTMHEWLENGPKVRDLRTVKHVLPRYGHQDLYWSVNAPRDVYPKIVAGLG